MLDEGLPALVYPVESSQLGNNEFGTGFIIYRDGNAIYFLTCAHVINVVGKDYLQIDGIAATVIAMGASDDLDLAVLSVPEFSIKSEFDLLITGKEGDSITIIGIHDYGKHRSRKPIHGHLGRQSSLKKPKTRGGWIKAWELNMETDDYLQPGYSGSPVLHGTSNRVIGIVSHRRGQGDKGLAISIEALHDLWPTSITPALLRHGMSAQGQLDNHSPQSGERQDYTSLDTKRLQRQIDSLQEAWDKLAEKIEGLRNDWIHETRTAERARISFEIENAEKLQSEIEAKINTFVARLQNLKS